MPGKVIVFTITGDQGMSVAHYLSLAGWEVAGFSRNPKSARAKEVAGNGIKVMQADMADRSSYEAQLKGYDAAFVNGDFWSIYGSNGQDGDAAAKEETRRSIDAVDACHQAGIGHIVFSTLDGGHDCAHWDSKYAVTKWMQQQGIPGTQLYLTYYFNGITKYHLLNKQDDGSFLLQQAGTDDTLVPGLAVDQVGAWVETALGQPDKWKGKDMYACTEVLSVGEMAKILSRLSGKDVKTLGLTKEAFQSEGFKKQLGQELWDNWRLFAENAIKRDVEQSKALINDPWDFEAWAKQDKELKQILGY